MSHEFIINKVFESITELNSVKINALYADEAIFEDPSIGEITGVVIKYWWQFLYGQMSNISIEVLDIKINGDEAIVSWKNNHLLKLTGKQLSLDFTTNFTFKDGFIVFHKNNYDFKQFVKQAFGPIAAMSGNKIMQKMIKGQLNKMISNYIKHHSLKLA